MNREFVLRDNEIAINQPDGTVIIMNIVAYKQMGGHVAGTPDTALLKENQELRNKIADLKSTVQSASDRISLLDNNIELLRKENFNLKIKASQEEGLKNGYKNKVEQLQKEVNDLKAKASSSKMVLWGAGTKFTKRTPDYVYVTSTGEIFLSGLAIERAYNLPKGSVSAYFADRQERLYPRNPDGTRRVDEARGDIFRLGVIRRFTNSLFLHNDWNCPIFDAIDEAIKTAKKYTTEL